MYGPRQGTTFLYLSRTEMRSQSIRSNRMMSTDIEENNTSDAKILFSSCQGGKGTLAALLFVLVISRGSFHVFHHI